MVKNIMDGANDIARLSVDQMVDTLGSLYSGLLKSMPDRLPAIMLWSSPGVGKSQGVRQLAKWLQKKMGREVFVTDVRLLLFNPVDLRGIPVANVKKSAAIWLKPQIFAMNPEPSVINLLFLDEISAAPPSVQAAAYQLVLDRAVGEHELPRNCIVIGAGNRVEDRTMAWKMPSALANRFCHLEIVPDPDSWRHWAIANSIHPLIIGYIARHPDHLNLFDAESDEIAWASPRSWEMVSTILSHMDFDAAYPLLCGTICIGTATEFRAWSKIAGQIPTMEAIFSGKKCKIPNKPDAMYALVSSMSAYAAAHQTDSLALGHSLAYACGFAPEFSALLLHDYLNMAEGMEQRLLVLPEFDKLQKSVGKYL